MKNKARKTIKMPILFRETCTSALTAASPGAAVVVPLVGALVAVASVVVAAVVVPLVVVAIIADK